MTSKKSQPRKKKTKDQVDYIVGGGASAGGLEALSQFLEAFQVQDEVAVIIAQHLSQGSQHE